MTLLSLILLYSLYPAVSFTSDRLALSPPSLYPCLVLKDQQKSVFLVKSGATMLQVNIKKYQASVRYHWKVTNTVRKNRKINVRWFKIIFFLFCKAWLWWDFKTFFCFMSFVWQTQLNCAGLEPYSTYELRAACFNNMGSTASNWTTVHTLSEGNTFITASAVSNI